MLGGSFNPAHEGHLYISEMAIKMLGLKQVWWLVSPANPLKNAADLADYKTRIRKANNVATHSGIIVSDIENKMGTTYTIDTLKMLKRRFFRCQFVWLMGGDNLATFHKWRKWRDIAKMIPIVVLDRDNFAARASKYPAGRKLKGFSQRGGRIKSLNNRRLPQLMYYRIRKNPASSTKIRNKLSH